MKILVSKSQLDFKIVLLGMFRKNRKTAEKFGAKDRKYFRVINPNKAGLFEGSFYCSVVNLTLSLYFKEN